MNMAVILKHLDELLNDCKLDEAGEFLSESLNEAFRVEDYMSAITLYNEQIGFLEIAVCLIKLLIHVKML